MAVPSISNIYPASCHTGGEAMVRILGGNFKVPPSPLDSYVPSGPTVPTVEVLFGGEPSPRVLVVNRALLYAAVPASPISDPKTGAGAGTVDVVIRNIDAVGAVIPGETTTALEAFEYLDVVLTTESDLTRVIRRLIRTMRQQIIPNVVYSPHTDYDAETGDQLDIVSTATLPSLAIIGPVMEENRFYSRNQQEYVDGHGHQVLRRVAYTADLKFTLLGLASKSAQLLNLQAATIQFFDRTLYFKLLRDSADPAAGYVTYEMVIDRTGAPSIIAASDDANVRSFETRITIRGFDIEAVAGFEAIQSAAVNMSEPVSDADDAITIESEVVV